MHRPPQHHADGTRTLLQVEEIDYDQDLKKFEQATITYTDEISRIEVSILLSHILTFAGVRSFQSFVTTSAQTRKHIMCMRRVCVHFQVVNELIRNEDTQVDLYSRDICNLVDLGDEENAKMYAYAPDGEQNLVKVRGRYNAQQLHA